jgi:histidyl-tRNA synthetase
MRFQAPRGTQDILPDRQPYWTAVNDAVQYVTRLFGYQRIDTPVIEAAGLFEKGSGDTTDVVEKEMYIFRDRGGESLALTPEGTPSICRAYLEHGMASWQQPVRLYTSHPMFRYDRPQKGRYRQHTQFDCEVFGSSDPLIDAEVITLLWTYFRRLGLRNVVARIGSLDDLEPRRAYIERLKDYYAPHREQLSEDSQRRLDRNPLRLLDSKEERDLPFKEAAPKLLDQLSAPAAEHHEAVLAALVAAGVPYEIDPLLVRGFDYYNRTVFEFVPPDDDRAQGTLGGGGRYDGLMEVLGGPPTPAVGFGSGIERVILEMERWEVELPAPEPPAVFIVHRAEGSTALALRLATDLRDAGIGVVTGESSRSFKSQFRSADGSGARFAVIIGDSEVERGIVVLKDLRGDAEQRDVSQPDLVAAVQAGIEGTR